MYQAVDGNPRMTRNQAMERYPAYYILMQKDGSGDLRDPMGTVLFIGDDGDGLFSLQVNLPINRGIVYEGLNIQTA